MTQWEYRREAVTWNGEEWIGGDVLDQVPVMTLMDSLGADGWELVSTDVLETKLTYYTILWFKRPRSQPPQTSRSSW
jgi:hypothetical protein